jgi:hypothetical protein
VEQIVLSADPGPPAVDHLRETVVQSYPTNVGTRAGKYSVPRGALRLSKMCTERHEVSDEGTRIEIAADAPLRPACPTTSGAIIDGGG